MAKGKKFDDKKNPLELISAAAEWALGEVLKHGRVVYDAWNWEDGIEYSRIIGAIKRHRNAIEAGEDYDKDSGLLHAAHLFCESMFLLHFQLMDRTDLDDRRTYTGPPTTQVGVSIEAVKEMADLLNKDQPFNYAVPMVVDPQPATVTIPIDGCYCNLCTIARQGGRTWQASQEFSPESRASLPASSVESTVSPPPTKSD